MSNAVPAPELIQVKLMLKSACGKETDNLARRFPGRLPVWGRCEFILDYDARDYDWLVVYDDLPPVGGERFTLWDETLACPRTHTLLITAEPSTIKTCRSRSMPLGSFSHRPAISTKSLPASLDLRLLAYRARRCMKDKSLPTK